MRDARPGFCTVISGNAGMQWFNGPCSVFDTANAPQTRALMLVQLEPAHGLHGCTCKEARCQGPGDVLAEIENADATQCMSARCVMRHEHFGSDET